MSHSFKLHETDSKAVCILQTHRHLLPKDYSQMDIHPSHNGSMALRQIKRHYQLPHQPFFMQQVHGADNIILETPPTKHFWRSADACYTRHPDIICTVMTADCLPVLITDQQAGFVAAVHCGWRSLYQGILTKLLDKVQSQYGLIVWFGPSICRSHYRVDKAFKDHYLQTHPNAEHAFTEVIDNHCHADLKVLARAQLNNEDLKSVQDCEVCTYGHDSYDSWRQNKTTARQASMIWIKPLNRTSDNQG